MMGVSAASPSSCCLRHVRPHLAPSRFTPLPRVSDCGLLLGRRYTPCHAAKQLQQQIGAAKKKAGRRKASERPPAGDGVGSVEVIPGPQNGRSHPSPLPKPPAGFVLDEHGRVLLASSRRIATIVDATNNLPLECVIRRVFQSSAGEECMLLCPIDPPVQILKSTNLEGWSAVNDEEVEAIIPTAAYALAKIHMHLVVSGFCYTARGGFCYSEEDILEFHTVTAVFGDALPIHPPKTTTRPASYTDDGEAIEGLPTEGLKITCFNLDGTNYMIYTPSDPLLFVAVKGKNGILQIADDDLLEDPAIISAIDEETEFNALVEEEAALLESLLGER